MPRFVLGPAFGNYNEPTEVTTRDAVLDNLRVAAGGKVTVRLVPDDPANPTNRPKNLYAFYVNPPSSVPDVPARTPEFFFGSSAPRGSTDVVGKDGDILIEVAGVPPGSTSFIQTIAEYES